MDPMKLTPAESYEEAWREAQRLKAEAGDATPVCRIVRSPYGGFVVVALDATLYADMISDELVDGLPAFPLLKRAAPGNSMP